MEAKLYREVYQLVTANAPAARRPRELYTDVWVVVMFLWAVIHDRPASWASDPAHWPAGLDRPLASQSRVSRRLRTLGVVLLIERLSLAASDRVGVPLVKRIDCKPLTVGAYSKDRDAKRGRVADGVFAKGYRPHVIAHGRAPRRFVLPPLSDHDATAAPILLPMLEGGGYVVGNNAYDANACHLLAAAANHQLVAPPRECNKGVRDARHNTPERLRGLDLVDSPLERCGAPPGFGRALYDYRQRIASAFGGLTLCGLGALPAWVRGPRRVALWAAGKIVQFLWQLAKKAGLTT